MVKEYDALLVKRGTKCNITVCLRKRDTQTGNPIVIAEAELE